MDGVPVEGLPGDVGPAATPLPAGTLNGQVLAGKAVTVKLYDNTDTLVATVPANPDGTFSLTAPAGTYAVVATAPGFLSAAGSATITSAGTTTLPNVTLLAGDIDGKDKQNGDQPCPNAQLDRGNLRRPEQVNRHRYQRARTSQP